MQQSLSGQGEGGARYSQPIFRYIKKYVKKRLEEFTKDDHIHMAVGLEGFPMKTVPRGLVLQDENGFWGWSLCKKGESFNKEKAQEIAIGRAKRSAENGFRGIRFPLGRDGNPMLEATRIQVLEMGILILDDRFSEESRRLVMADGLYEDLNSEEIKKILGGQKPFEEEYILDKILDPTSRVDALHQVLTIVQERCDEIIRDPKAHRKMLDDSFETGSWKTSLEEEDVVYKVEVTSMTSSQIPHNEMEEAVILHEEEKA